jgi:hypothetical protein
MAGPESWMLFATLGFFHFIANLLMTREVFSYFPFAKERIWLNVLIWAIPVAGALYVFRRTGLEHYKTHETAEAGVSLGLLGMDEIFNPNAKPRYTAEAKLEDNHEVKDGWVDTDKTQ